MESYRCHGIRKVLLKLETSINNENFYEAHQMYRTLYFRYLGQKRYSDLIQLLYSGSLLLLEHGQHTSGADLGILLIDVLRRSGTEPSSTHFKKLIDIFALIDSTYPERDTFVQKALLWSRSNSNFSLGHPEFHQKLAQVYWIEKNHPLARHHFLQAKDGYSCASLLVDIHERQGYTCETEIFITQTVLQCLCLDDKETAIVLFKSYIKQHTRVNGPPFLFPLLNFLFYLLKTIEVGKTSSFTILCKQYFTSLNKDPSFLQYMDRIGQLFFNIESSQKYNRGLFGSLFQSFFHDLDDDDTTKNQQITSQERNLLPELD